MAGCVHLKTGGSKFRCKGLKMKFSFAVAVVLAGISVNGLAQQENTFRVKPSHSAAKAPKKSAPIGNTAASPATASAATSKDLQNLEKQTAKSSAPSGASGKKTPGTAPALKPAKDKPNPPINFGGTGGGKRAGTTNKGTNQSANPYQGRLRQKNDHQ
jgi:hypothetical protein